jgi:hypothetical protein
MPETVESINDEISTAHCVKHDLCPMNTELALRERKRRAAGSA